MLLHQEPSLPSPTVLPSVLDTPFGPTKLVSVGLGPMKLIFHGGPGFDHKYLVPHFHCLSNRRTLVYFDQLGVGGSPRPAGSVEFRAICDHAGSVISALACNGHLHFIAHSWGLVVLLGALRQLGTVSASGLVLNPIPTNRARFDAVRMNLFSRMPPELIQAVTDETVSTLSPRQIAGLLPYYVAHGCVPDLSALACDMRVYRDVYQSIGDFDLAAALTHVKDFDVVLGGFDFTTRELVSDIVGAARSCHTMADAGHFPFAERPAEFSALMGSLT